MCKIKTDGEGLYLGPTSGEGFETVRNGLNLMKQGGLYDGRELILGPDEQGGLYDGRGLILGPNSPFKNIPILGMIL